MRIGVIGNEPCGPVLAKAWASAGHEIVGAAVDSPEAIERVEALLPDLPIAGMAAVAEDAEVVLLVVPNSDVEISCAGLADLGLFGPRKIVIHFSPTNGCEVLDSAALHGAVTIAMHPVLSFTGTSVDLQVLKNSVVAVTAPEVYLPIAQALVIELGAEPIVVRQEQRASYAESFEVASEFSKIVVQRALGILNEAQVESPQELVVPVVRAAIDDALRAGPLKIYPEDAQ
jgi:predicted short-subunit dehydrogenase-like oxidoreductase (DUF2520 family)